MKVDLTRRYKFCASHRLHNPAFSDGHNRQVYGKCNNPHGHGHNYVLWVTVSGPVDQRTGMVCNLADLDDCVQQEVIERFDHQNLNLMPEFAELVPTSENLAVCIDGILQRNFCCVAVERVRLEETASNSFEYAQRDELAR